MGTLATPIVESLKFTDFIMGLVTEDVTDAIGIRRSRGEAGASIAWIVGHLCHYRYEIMKLLGRDVENPYADHFGAQGATAGDDYPSMHELKAGWRDVSTETIACLEAAQDDQLTAPMGDPDSPHGEQKVLDTLVFYMWHESYHMGQLGTLRAQFGLTPTATLAVEAAQQR